MELERRERLRSWWLPLTGWHGKASMGVPLCSAQNAAAALAELEVLQRVLPASQPVPGGGGKLVLLELLCNAIRYRRGGATPRGCRSNGSYVLVALAFALTPGAVAGAATTQAVSAKAAVKISGPCFDEFAARIFFVSSLQLPRARRQADTLQQPNAEGMACILFLWAAAASAVAAPALQQ
ncbi:hypothetical protein cyc_00129 [Cyclospora cayetanensis]|uniref:Uncharacterized protein n=1 Tax=Cyclospora cayetanensis TaxID=88456 RepID=A0A1D3D4R0_9EIME|nr:hypothetical protein cyc_00129 [Cyclospora cayetanensis]